MSDIVQLLREYASQENLVKVGVSSEQINVLLAAADLIDAILGHLRILENCIEKMEGNNVVAQDAVLKAKEMLGRCPFAEND